MNQNLTIKELKQVQGGSGTGTGVRPNAVQFTIPEPIVVHDVIFDDDKDK